MCCLRSTKQRGTLTEYLSTFFGFELFPCPKHFTPPRAVLRGKQMGFGHPVAKNDSNIVSTEGGVRYAGDFGANSSLHRQPTVGSNPTPSVSIVMWKQE